MAASSDAVPVSERSDLCSDSSNKRSGMWVAAYGYSKEEKSPGELIALYLRMFLYCWMYIRLDFA